MVFLVAHPRPQSRLDDHGQADGVGLVDGAGHVLDVLGEHPAFRGPPDDVRAQGGRSQGERLAGGDEGAVLLSQLRLHSLVEGGPVRPDDRRRGLPVGEEMLRLGQHPRGQQDPLGPSGDDPLKQVDRIPQPLRDRKRLPVVEGHDERPPRFPVEELAHSHRYA